MESFKCFFEAAYAPEMRPVSKEPIQQKTPSKWNVLLFAGDFNPITKDDYSRIQQFIGSYIKENRESFADKVDIGLITQYDDTEEGNLVIEQQFGLTLEERSFLTTKLFGLKLFGADFKNIAHLTKFAEGEENESLTKEVAQLVDTLKENFFNSNVLVVLREGDTLGYNILEEASKLIEDPDITVGAVTYKHNSETLSTYGSPIDGNIVKAITLMDFDRPNPEDLKNFAHRYKLSEYLEYMKRIHFRTYNENYFDAFKMAFPMVSTTGQMDESTEWNLRIVLEMMKKMFLKQ